MKKKKKTPSKKPAKKKKTSNLKYFVWAAIIAAAVFVATNNTAKRKIVVLYNVCSVHFEDINHIFFSEKHFGVSIPSAYTVHGIDVSHWQRKINWSEVNNLRPDEPRIAFVFIKSSEGKIMSDKYFSYNMENARKNGVICGAYHYYKPGVNSAEQAKNFISLVKLQKGDLPPVLDIEEESPFGNDNMRKGIKNWLQLVEAHYGMKPIIYCSNSFHKDYLSGEDFKDYPFWIAHYYKSKIKTSSKWIFWQHSDKARVNGVYGDVDINVFNGNSEDLKNLCKK
ncbi:glycosyl hydrolase [Bacteroidia bacterium]|nr:glycosyl hydrolase [Bacteroidia bacterium]